jgi:Uma2 family endonuclease
VTNPLVDKLAVYAGLGIREVWVWRAATSAIEVLRLDGDEYRAAPSSAVLADFDLAQLAGFIRPGQSQIELALIRLRCARADP